MVIIKPIIKTAGPSDGASIVDVWVRAFTADPAVRWGWPDSERYLKRFPSFARAFGGKAFTHESAYYVDGYTAELIRLPSNVFPDEDKLVRLMQHTVSEKIQKDFFPVFPTDGSLSPKRAALVFTAFGRRSVSTGQRVWLSFIATSTYPVQSWQQACLSWIFKS